MQGTLYFEKISQFDRIKEPVTVSIPFAKGDLPQGWHLDIWDPEVGVHYANQSRVLANWSDGSVKWLLVHFQPDLPGNGDKTLAFGMCESPQQASAKISVVETGDGYRLNTGPLQFSIGRSGFAPVYDVSLDGTAVLDAHSLGGFEITCDGRKVSTLEGPVEIIFEDEGPLLVTAVIRGWHRDENGKFLEFSGRITAFAGKPYIQIEHQFVNTEEASEISLERLAFKIKPQACGDAHLALGQGYYRTDIQTSDEQVEMTLDDETMLYQANEHFVDCFYGDFWVDWRDSCAGVAATIHQAHQNFPKRLKATPKGIVVDLYPRSAPPARVLQGMAKTHRIQLYFHGPDTPLEEISTRSLQFQLPDRPALSREWFRNNNPWQENYFAEQLPKRLITYFERMHDGRPIALGMMHFGDAPDAHYTDQGRGRGETVWVNNEYDRPHWCSVLYGLVGERRMLDSALVTARHWLDVDLCHYSQDPLIDGGLKIHTAYHGTGGVTPSHEWTNGFLDYYFWTGRQEGLDGARSVAANIMRHLREPRMLEPGQAAVRESGWALRAMVAMYMATGEQQYLDEAKHIVELFLAWLDEFGGLLAPYTSHSMPRVPFMISLTVNSFARYLLVADDERVKELVLKTVDDMLEHCMGADGIPYYKELPSLRRSAPTSHLLEALTHAYRFSGDSQYLKIATRVFAALSEGSVEAPRGPKFIDSSGAVIGNMGGGRVFASTFPSILVYACQAGPEGFLDWYEYPY